MPNARVLSEKQAIVEELTRRLSSASAGVFVDYRGITVAEDRARLVAAIQAGFAYDDLLIAEKYFERSREINCAAYRAGGEIVVSPCEEPKTRNAFLTFKDKYFDGGKEEYSEGYETNAPYVIAHARMNP